MIYLDKKKRKGIHGLRDQWVATFHNSIRACSTLAMHFFSRLTIYTPWKGKFFFGSAEFHQNLHIDVVFTNYILNLFKTYARSFSSTK